MNSWVKETELTHHDDTADLEATPTLGLNPIPYSDMGILGMTFKQI